VNRWNQEERIILPPLNVRNIFCSKSAAAKKPQSFQDRKNRDCLDIAFYGFHHAPPWSMAPNPQGDRRDQLATI
jgi:hypothetical protein